MRLVLAGPAAAALLAFASAEASAADIAAEIGIVSDYRFRGISLSDGKPAAQASVTIGTEQGFYGELWGSTIDEPGFSADAEVDLTAGYAFDLSDRLTLDLAANYYVHPGESSSNYGELTATAEYGFPALTLRAGFAWSPPQRGTRDEEGAAQSNLYWSIGAAHEFKQVPITLEAELGHERGAFDAQPSGAKWDWRVGGSYRLEALRLAIFYSGSDAAHEAIVASAFLEF